MTYITSPGEKSPAPSEETQSQPQPPPQPQIIEKEIIKEVPVEVIKEVVKEVPIIDQQEVQKQVQEKLREKIIENKKKADEARKQRRTENLNRILEFVREKKKITNQDIRDLLQVSQSTASNYLTELVSRGILKKENKG